MTKAAVLYDFWSGFGLPAYEENAVPSADDAPEFPYITYSLVTDSFGSEVAMVGNLWYRSTSWAQANAKAEAISAAIGRGGHVIPCDGGLVWLKRGVPFANRMGDDADTLIKRIIINISAEFLTAD